MTKKHFEKREFYLCRAATKLVAAKKLQNNSLNSAAGHSLDSLKNLSAPLGSQKITACHGCDLSKILLKSY